MITNIFKTNFIWHYFKVMKNAIIKAKKKLKLWNINWKNYELYKKLFYFTLHLFNSLRKRNSTFQAYQTRKIKNNLLPEFGSNPHHHSHKLSHWASLVFNSYYLVLHRRSTLSQRSALFSCSGWPQYGLQPALKSREENFIYIKNIIIRYY